MLNRLKDSVKHMKVAYISAAIMFSISFGGFFAVGRIYNNALARALIEAMQASLSTLSFAVITSASTVVALLMTMVSFAKNMDNEFEHDFYVRAWAIATIAAIDLILASILLMLMTIPIMEAEALATWYNAVYWIIVVISSSMMALLVGMIISLYRTLGSLISFISPGWEV